MPSYYDSNKATLANARSLHPSSNAQQHFPEEGLYLGELTGGSMELPALFDLTENKGFCILYNNENDRKRANTSLERLEGYADPNLTICDTQRFDSFYQQLTTQLQSEFGYESDRHRYHTGCWQEEHCSSHRRRNGHQCIHSPHCLQGYCMG